MTKPKTVSALLAEANKLARERGIGQITDDAHVNTPAFSTSGFGTIWPDPGIQISVRFPDTPGKIVALRCLIAALHEVPVRKRDKR